MGLCGLFSRGHDCFHINFPKLVDENYSLMLLVIIYWAGKQL